MPNDEDIPLVSRSHGLVVRAVDDKKRSARFVASTEAIDSYGEIVEQSWDLARYLTNPVVLFGHQSRELPIGKATDVGLVNGQLEATIVFASAAANPKAENVWQSVQEGTLCAVSVGFNPRDIRVEMRNGEEVLVLANNELFEISVVPIPANHEALAKMRAKAVETARNKLKAADSAAEPKESTNMATEKELTASLEQKSAELTESTKLVSAERAKADVLNERCKTLETERKAQQDRADKLASELVARDLDALIGSKISPAEKPGLVKLAALSPELYGEQLTAIKARPDMKMLGVNVTKAAEDAPPVGEPDLSTGGDDLEASIQRSLQAH